MLFRVNENSSFNLLIAFTISLTRSTWLVNQANWNHWCFKINHSSFSKNYFLFPDSF